VAEQRPSKSRELVADLISREPSEKELAERYGKRPELRMRADAPAVTVTDSTPAKEVLAGIEAEESGALVVQNSDGAPAAVVVSVDRYLGLVGTELARSSPWTATLDGTFAPKEKSFQAAHVEQVDPSQRWI
jgi:hypothetical protein